MIQIRHLGDSALVIELGQTIDEDTHRRVRAVVNRLEQQPLLGMREFVPAFATVTVYYDPLQASYAQMQREVERLLQGLEDAELPSPNTVEIPVLYGGEWGPDLDVVAAHNGLTPDEVIEIHTSAPYLVYMIGFAPGFPYLGGMSERIATPRRSAPRLSIPAGSVGIAGMQTGVYPIATPGGWQLIGRTPMRLFRPKDERPTLLQAGDLVRFRQMTEREYATWQKEGRA